MNRLVWLLLCCTFFSSTAFTKPLAKEQVPEPLTPWISWVVQDNPERACPFLYSNYAQKRCRWPSSLNLQLTPDKAEFSSHWQVYKDSWIGLPGDSQHWPSAVTVNDKTALVMDRNGVPSIKVLSGDYEIKGHLPWDRMPDNLTIPDDTGLINLSINGSAITMPTIRDGQLWLKASESGQKKADNIQNTLDIQVFRKITDDVPLHVTTRLILDISGEQREMKLAKPLLDGFIPLSVQSPLPARLEPDGQLLVQVRPGRWQIDVDARNVNDLQALPLNNSMTNWPESEIWVFDARPDLRVVDIERLDAIDASQSNLSEEWQRYPAYKINQGQAMGFKVIRRGDPEPEPNQLTINRKLWLDFNGEGYTANDRITGKMTRDWRLNALPQTQLGRVTLDGNTQLITQQGNTNKHGVEVRKGMMTLEADSRITGDIGILSAVGWEQSFHHVSAELNLPPGWRLLAASGVDNVPDSWISRWTLLDLFLVLIAALATSRIWNVYWGLLALMTLILIWHEPESPHFVWLNILAATALINVLPAGKFLKIINSYRTVCWLALVLMTLPFMVDQLRTGLYPQLEKPFQVIDSAEYPTADQPEMAEMAMQQNSMDQSMKSKAGDYAIRSLSQALSYPEQEAVNFDRIDPKAKVQTGPGLPQWHWNKVQLSWNGSVDAQQPLHLWYLSPTMTLLLNFIRVALVSVLALLMFGVAEKFKPHRPKFTTVTPVMLGFLLLPLLSQPWQKAHADYPSETLLNELKARLQEVETPDCLPACATIQHLHMAITDKAIEMTLAIHAQESVTLPLPSEYNQWFPNQVLDNGEPSPALYRNNNGLWIHLTQGEHKVILRGAMPLLSQFSLPLPLKPKRVTLEKSGWDVVGIQENGVPDAQLHVSRTGQTQTDKNKALLEPGVLPPFVRVERTLQLGLDWRVITRIIRLSPAGSVIVLSVPLLSGESVSTAGIRVKEGKVEVNMSSQQADMQWESTLEKSEKIDLVATQTEQWIDVWKADVSPIWHVDSSGIAMIYLNNEAQWLPEWHPWQGEKITLQITRPEAVAGQTLTIDNSNLSIKPGQRLRDANLTFNVRSSQGGQHTLTLPENAVLQSVAINGQPQPIRQQGRKLTVPINPGEQDVAINWQEATPMASVITTPLVDVGQVSVNTTLNINLGEDRWVLFVFGPKLGPAVLFWGVLLVIFMLSLGFGKITLTPLKNWQWFLLLIGLSQIPLMSAGIVIAWLILLGWRHSQNTGLRYFNALQIIIGGLTLVSLGLLFYAVAQGLLSSPDMRIMGNQSSAFNLNWYQDRSLSTLPTATAISMPILVYRLLMLTWALWLAVSLLNWLKWGWGCFASNGLWHKKPVDTKPSEGEPRKK